MSSRPSAADSRRMTARSAAACWRARWSSVTSRMTPTKPVGRPSQPLIARTWTSPQRSAPEVVRKRCSKRASARSPASSGAKARACGGAVVGVHELPRRAAERVLDACPVAAVQFSLEVRPAALLVGLEHAVDHALDDAAVALLAAAQAALGVAERGQVGVDDDGAELRPSGVDDRAAAGQQRERALGRVDAHLDVADLVAAQRAQQRRLVRAEAAGRRGACRPKASAHSSGCRSVVAGGVAAAEVDDAAVGVGTRSRARRAA